MLVLWSLLCNFFTKHFRYLKWRNPHLYKLYGYSLCKGNPTPKTAKNKVQETLHFRYLKLLDLLVIFVSWHLSKVADESQQQLRSEQEPSQRRWFGPKILVKCSMFLVKLARDLTRPIYPKWWFSKGNLLVSGKSRLVKYYNLARCIPKHSMGLVLLISQF